MSDLLGPEHPGYLTTSRRPLSPVLRISSNATPRDSHVELLPSASLTRPFVVVLTLTLDQRGANYGVREKRTNLYSHGNRQLGLCISIVQCTILVLKNYSRTQTTASRPTTCLHVKFIPSGRVQYGQFNTAPCSIVRGRMKGADSAIYSIMHCCTVQYIYIAL